MVLFPSPNKVYAYHKFLLDWNPLLWRRGFIDHWLKIVLTITVLVNLYLTRLYYLTGSGMPPVLLDNYQILKPNLVINHSPSLVPLSPSRHAVVTTLYNDAYALPVAVLGRSLASANVTARRIAMVVPNRLSERSLCIVRAAGWQPYEVPLIQPPRGGKGVFYRFLDTFTKLHLWRLEEIGIERVVYLDGDTLVRQNIDELFQLPFPFAAAPDVYGKGDPRGFPISFNTGVLALHTSTSTFEELVRALPVADFPLGEADQAFLNLYFGAEVARISYAYNGNLAIKWRSPALWEALRPVMKVVHYTSPAPFSKDVKNIGVGIPNRKQMLHQIETARRARAGLHREEIDWWVDVWRGFEVEKQEELEMCGF